MKKSNHQANIVRITEILPHNNADTLELIHIGGYQCVTKKGTFKPGDLAVYIQPDSVVPQTEPFRFIWGQYEDERSDHEGILPVPERRRRITVRKFRGEWSEGLLLPVTDFSGGLLHDPELAYGWLQDGQDVSDILGITHYDPDAGVESTKGYNTEAPRRRFPKTFKGWFYFVLRKLGFRGAGKQLSEEVSFDLPVYDVDAYKNYQNAFVPDELVIVTEKIHGSNARFVFLDGKMYAGSRTLWKSPKSNCIWRKAVQQHTWIEKWCRAHEGYALYGEVTPTQKGFNYGCKEGEVKFFVFDIRKPDGHWMGKGEMPQDFWADLDTHWVPRISPMGSFGFNAEVIKNLADGQSTVPGANHIREGVVVTPLNERHVHGLGRLILKIVSNKFLEKDSK